MRAWSAAARRCRSSGGAVGLGSNRSGSSGRASSGRASCSRASSSSSAPRTPTRSRFDDVVGRRGTRSLKYDRYEQDVMPFWVADMDFACPDAITAGLQRRLQHPLLGYSSATGVHEPICAYLAERHGVREPRAAELLFLPGLVVALNLIAKLAASSRRSVMTASPVYPPFLTSPPNAGAGLVDVPLRWDAAQARFTLDFAVMDAALEEDGSVGVFLLCNPHNPVGRAYSAEELREAARFCRRHDLILVSDEVHCDLVLPGHRHVSTLSLYPGPADAEAAADLRGRTIALHAPSKTFNVAGLGAAFAHVPDARLRAALKREMRGICADVGALGFEAMEIAYADPSGDCAQYRDELAEYLAGNFAFLQGFLDAELAPWLAMGHAQEATYLAWLDARGLRAAMSAHGDGSPARWLEREARVALNDGAVFGSGDAYNGFVRMNLGCPRSTLQAGLERIRDACRKLE